MYCFQASLPAATVMIVGCALIVSMSPASSPTSSSSFPVMPASDLEQAVHDGYDALVRHVQKAGLRAQSVLQSWANCGAPPLQLLLCVLQLTNCCSAYLLMDFWPPAMHCTDSTAEMMANAHQFPQCPWFWIGDMHA